MIVELAGPILALIAVALVAYLVPVFLRRKDFKVTDTEQERPFGDRVQVVRVDDDEEPVDSAIGVSTPMTRGAEVEAIRMGIARAAARRRRVLIFLGLVLLGTVVASGLRYTPWWSVAVAGGAIVGFVVVARFSVAAMHRTFDRRLEAALLGDDVEHTVIVEFVQPGEQGEDSIELSMPITFAGSLWDPVPVTVPTYVQRPLAPRTVRTIDLSAPSVEASRVPVSERVAPAAETEGPAENVDGRDEHRPRAVGE